MLAETYYERGEAEAGLVVVADALSQLDTLGKIDWQPELLRLQGELLLLSGDHFDDAEVCFDQALDIAHRQRAKSLELRAATSLARLWRRQGKDQEAHKVLELIFNGFTEGFDTADLLDAKALLAELSRGR